MNIIYLEVNGTRYNGWIDVKITKSIENLCGSFKFSSSALQDKHGNINEFPVKMGDSCKVYIDESIVINGWIEKIEVELDNDTHTITIEGRDRANDLVDSSLSQKLNFKPPVTLKQITEGVLKNLNLTNIKVIDPYNLPAFNTAKTKGLGAKAFDFIETFAKKRQVILTTNTDGNIEFQRASTIKIDAVLTTDKNNIGTIKSSKVSYDNTKRFHFYAFHGQKSISSSVDIFGVKQDTKTVVDVAGTTTDNEVRTSRAIYIQPGDNGTEAENKEMAKWEANFRRSQSMIYTCSVQGYYPLNQTEIWLPNRLIRIKDKYTDIDSVLLITNIVYEKSNEKGSVTTLQCKTKDAFTPKPNKSEKDKSDYKEGEDIFIKK